MTPAPTLTELIATVRTDAGTDDPLAQLATASSTISELEEVGDATLGFFVDQCRRAGHSWSEISSVLGVSKQAAHKRFTPPTFERFTARARTAVQEATTAARALKHNYVGTEHILLGILAGDGIATTILNERRITAKTVADKLTPGSEPPAPDPIGFTPLAVDALTATLRVALTMGHNYIGTEHMLLALFIDPEGLAAKILAELGVTEDAVRARVVEMLSGYVARATPPPAPQGR